jgi:hypothetical protein
MSFNGKSFKVSFHGGSSGQQMVKKSVLCRVYLLASTLKVEFTSKVHEVKIAELFPIDVSFKIVFQAGLILFLVTNLYTMTFISL